MTATGLLERSIGYTLGSLHLVTAEALDAPTPCRGWPLRALLEHMYDALGALHEAVDPGWMCLDGSFDAGEDPVGALRDRACVLLGAWTGAAVPEESSVDGHPLATRIVAAVGALEVAVHGWDVARACGVEREIPAGLARELLEFAPLVVGEEDRPARFAPPVDVAPDAPAGQQLLAFLGRDRYACRT